jgi:hypothetical protein
MAFDHQEIWIVLDTPVFYQKEYRVMRSKLLLKFSSFWIEFKGKISSLRMEIFLVAVQPLVKKSGI